MNAYNKFWILSRIRALSKLASPSRLGKQFAEHRVVLCELVRAGKWYTLVKKTGAVIQQQTLRARGCCSGGCWPQNLFSSWPVFLVICSPSHLTTTHLSKFPPTSLQSIRSLRLYTREPPYCGLLLVFMDLADPWPTLN